MRGSYWLRRQSANFLALTIVELEREDRVLTIRELARISITTPAVVRKLLKDYHKGPVERGWHYYSVQLSSIFRNRLNDLGDERAQTIPLGEKILLRNKSRRRRTRPTWQERLTPKLLVAIERRAATLGQWLSCEETAWVLGVTKQTLHNWRRAKRAAWRASEDESPWPIFFASPPRTERLVDEDMPDRILESRRDWQHAQEEVVPSSRRDPVTGGALERASGRYPPVVYDRNLLVAWARQWAYIK